MAVGTQAKAAALTAAKTVSPSASTADHSYITDDVIHKVMETNRPSASDSPSSLEAKAEALKKLASGLQAKAQHHLAEKGEAEKDHDKVLKMV